LAGVVLVLAIAISGSVVYYNKLVNESYQLPVGIQALIGQPDKVLLSQFTYSSQNHAYYLSKSSINTSSSEFPKTSPLSDSFTLGSNSKVKGQFSLKLPTNAGLGITTYDDTSNLSFTMIPQFSTLAGRQVSGHIVYPVGLSGAKVIYTIKANGAQEDIVYNRAPKNTIRLSYKLKLPTTLQARMMTGGNIGIYSANPALFGNISYGSSADELKVAKARQDSAKDNLVFVIPASTIITADGKLPISSNRGVSLSLSGDIVTVTAKGLENLRGAFSIDPSVIVVSVSNWQTGNNEGDITFDSTNNQISEGGLTGGELSSNSCGTSVSWCASSTTANTGFSLPVATSDASTVVYNGYIYFMGGINGGSVTIPTVDYAVLNANGSLGAPGSCAGTQETDWCESSTTANTGFSLPTATSDASAVVYNGYIYFMGGAIGSIFPTVDYAVLNANGSLGAPSSCAGTQETDWCESSTTANTGFSLPTATAYATTTVYNGYIYFMGGYTGSVPVPTVDYAVLNANGSLGAPGSCAGTQETDWCESSTTANTGFSLPIGTDAATTTVYNGYIYLMGGYNASWAIVPTVDYAVLNANGSLGAPGSCAGTQETDWCESSTTANTGFSLPIGTYSATTTVYNGYIYLIGGNNTGSSAVPTVDYAPIYNGGGIGPWVSTTSLPTATDYASAVAYNGYIYLMGGNTGSSAVPTVDYAQITSAGAVSNWSYSTSLSTGSLPNAIDVSTSVVYNGYIYEIGGCEPGCTDIPTVDYVAINSNGTLGTWYSTATLPYADSYSTAVAYNGYLYNIGGCSAGGSGCPSTVVDYASINSNGTLGAWTPTASLPAGGDYEASSVVYNGYIYEIGGCAASCPSTVVDYAAINSDGTLGAWTPLTSSSLPVAIAYANAVVYNGYIYEVDATTSTVYYASINSDGTLGSWGTASSSLPSGGVGVATDVVYNGYLYNIGGWADAAVDYAPINSNGTLGAWTATTSLVTGTGYASAVVYNGYIYEIAGYASGYTAVVEWAQINNGGPGTTSAWTPNPTNLLNPTENATSVVYNGYVYEIGGWTAAVEYAPINSNGTLGTWNWTSNLLSSIGQATSVVYNGYVYEIGGYSSGVLNAVEYAAINSNGTLGSWNYVSNFLPGGGVDSATSVAYNGYIYEIGGWTTTVYYAPINANGNLGTWASTTSLPAALYIATSVVYDGYIYEIGGDNTSSVAVSSVYYAPINSNGTIGSWTATTSLPYATSAATSVAYNGYIYEIGGYSSGVLNAVEYAAINSNGTLGPWTPTASLPTATGLATSVAYNGYAYEIGGYTTANTNTVDVTGLQSIPRVGRYSRLIDLSGLSGDDPTPYEVLVNGGDCSSGVCTNTNTNPGIGGLSGPGGIMVQYDFASNSCTTFNSLTTLPTGNSFMGVPKPLAYTVNGCSTATNVGRYMRITILLDDSQTATFPDITGNHTSINNLNVYYKAASTYRLMGGSTFSSGALQTLYAPP